MIYHIFKRILLSLPLLIGITFVSFLVIRLAPGEPTGLQTDLNPRVTAADMRRGRCTRARHRDGVLGPPLSV
jgi:peptide/nickel transport system permease protein